MEKSIILSRLDGLYGVPKRGLKGSEIPAFCFNNEHRLLYTNKY